MTFFMFKITENDSNSLFGNRRSHAPERTGNEPHGTIFRLGNIKTRCLHTLGIPKMYVKKIYLSGAWDSLPDYK